MRIFIDPNTGEMRAPSSEELAAQSKRSAASATGTPGTAAVREPEGINGRLLPNGLTEYEFNTPPRVDETACVQPDGTVGECTAEQTRALHAAPQPGHR